MNSPKHLSCKFCKRMVEYGPGMIMVEYADGDGFIAHEECYQMSGEDEGYIERLHTTIDITEDADELS